MMRTRVLVGSILALAAAAVLIADWYMPPWYPGLFICLMVAGLLAGQELVRLFPAAYRPSEPLAVAAILLCLTANWFPTLRRALQSAPPPNLPDSSAFVAVLFVFVAALIAAFMAEMARYREPGSAVPRLGALLLAVAYLGVLPELLRANPLPARAGPGHAGPDHRGAQVQRHRRVLHGDVHRPAQDDAAIKPEEDVGRICGGMCGSAVAAIALSFAAPAGSLFPGGRVEAAGFGLASGLAGVLGDLAESLLKRDCQTKDASKSIPGFGGLLDVVDSVLFAAPVAYLWFVWNGRS